MSRRAPYGGAVLIADKSAWQQANSPKVRTAWAAALRLGQIAVCSIVKHDLLYSTRDVDEFRALDLELSALRDVPVTTSAQRAAIAAAAELAASGPLHHRVPIPGLLIAAAAEEAGVGVLHYDRHYDRLSSVLSFESRWIARPGTL